MASLSNLRYGSVWMDKLFEMINQEFKSQEQNIKCCRILGSVAGSWGTQSYDVLRVRAQSLVCRLSLRPISSQRDFPSGQNFRQ